MNDHPGIAVIGGGAAGLMTAIAAGEAGGSVIVMEKGRTPGRKLLATGGGRCNLAHAGDVRSFLDGFDIQRGRFLKHAAYRFTPQDTMDFFETHGVLLKTERGRRVFPVSDRGSDVLNALVGAARSAGAGFTFSSPVTCVKAADAGFIVETPNGTTRVRAVVIATGGLSMGRTGSTGDGFSLAASLGHAVATPMASLVPLVTAERWPSHVEGLVLRNVALSASVGGKRVRRFGEMQFTADGIGGPITLEMSRYVTDTLNSAGGPVPFEIDLKPALDDGRLDSRLLREMDRSPRGTALSILETLLPRDLARLFTTEFGIPSDAPASHISRETRTSMRVLLKHLPLTVTATAPVEAALVTRGGVSLDEVDPLTMGSRLVSGLFFAGEVLDLDGDCGGYNLQMCWSTGSLAGRSAADYVAATRTD